MIRKLLKSSLRRFGREIINYPLPDWYLAREGLSEIFAAQDINCVIDVGANLGQFGGFLREIGYKGRIVSFEPVSASFKALAEKSKDDRDWHIHQLALGSDNKTLDINVMASSEFSSILPMNSFGNTFTAVAKTEQINVARLDSMMAEVVKGLEKPRVYLKMDTQGYDLQVLEGASGCLPLILGLQSEISLKQIYVGMPDYLTSLATLGAHGFSVTSFVPVFRDDKLRVVEFDCLMVRDS